MRQDDITLGNVPNILGMLTEKKEARNGR